MMYFHRRFSELFIAYDINITYYKYMFFFLLIVHYIIQRMLKR